MMWALPESPSHLRKGASELANDTLTENEREVILAPLRTMVLNTAKRFGKARFAQIATRHVDQARVMPKYLVDAARWLTAP
jgi:putative ATP-dependent endonuclease of the OLD family